MPLQIRSVRLIWLSALCAVALSGCFFRGGGKSCVKREEYQQSESVPGLHVPEDLDKPDATGRLVIPRDPASGDVPPPDNPCLQDPPDYFGRPLD